MYYLAGTILLLLFAWYVYSVKGSVSLFKDEDERARSMAITLAFALSASKGKINDSEVEIIKQWAGENIPGSRDDRKFHKAMTATRAFFHAGNKIDSNGICSELLERTSLGQRYSILELCMKVAAADDLATAKQLVFLRNLANWLEVDESKVSMMMESFVPVNIHEVQDVEFILGINNLMSPDDARDKLNREYRKWNGRVTNPDSKIRAQAKLMIKLITNLKNKQFSPSH